MKRFLLLVALASAVSSSAAPEVPVIRYECRPYDSEVALTPEVRKKAREDYGQKYLGKRQVLGDKIYQIYENQPTVIHCLFYEVIPPRPPERPEKRMLTLAPAGVFFCLIL